MAANLASIMTAKRVATFKITSVIDAMYQGVTICYKEGDSGTVDYLRGAYPGVDLRGVPGGSFSDSSVYTALQTGSCAAHVGSAATLDQVFGQT